MLSETSSAALLAADAFASCSHAIKADGPERMMQSAVARVDTMALSSAVGIRDILILLTDFDFRFGNQFDTLS